MATKNCSKSTRNSVSDPLDIAPTRYGPAECVAETDSASCKLAPAPERASEGKAVSERPDEAYNDPHRLARFYLQKQAHADRPRLVIFQGEFWRWTGTHWTMWPRDEIRGALVRHCKRRLDSDFVALTTMREAQGKERPKVLQVTTGLVSNVMQALSGEVMLAQDTPQPSWLGGDPARRNYLALQNGLLDVDALLLGEAAPLRTHSPLWFSPVCLPFDFDPQATCSRWNAFLARNLEGERSSNSLLLQQFFGYLLMPDTSQQRFLMMVGEGANGKSVICAVLRALLGEGNVSTVPLERFGDKFRLAGTLGKLANIVAEVGEMDKVAEGQLKAFVSGDAMEFERKRQTPFTARPTARLLLSTNNPPSFSDRSDALWRRMLLLRCSVQIPEGECVTGMDTAEWWRDAGELPGILNWSLAGLHQLRQQGRFIVPSECQDEVQQLRVESNPTRSYLQDHYRAGTGEIPIPDMYGAYHDWCKRNGCHALAGIGFGREVTRCFKDVKRMCKRSEGQRYNAYCGIELRDD